MLKLDDDDGFWYAYLYLNLLDPIDYWYPQVFNHLFNHKTILNLKKVLKIFLFETFDESETQYFYKVITIQILKVSF